MAMGLAICGVYLLVVILFADRMAAFFAGLLLALTPQQIVWSASAAVEPSASAACIAALLAAACFVRLSSTASLLGVAVAAAYAIQFRPESLLIVPVIAVLIWQRAPHEFTRQRLWWAALLFLGLAAVHVAHTAAVRNEGWGTSQARFAVSYVAANLRANGWFYVGDSRFPAAYTALAVLGLWGRRSEAGRLTVAWYFVVFLGITLLFYAGSYNYGADVRYSLATYPPLAIMAGLGLARLVERFDRVWPRRWALFGLTSALAAQFLWYLPQVRSTTDGAWAARADVTFAESLVPGLRGNSYVLTQNPGMFHVWGVSAGQTSLAVTDPARLNVLARQYPGGLYLHWNFWCNVQDPIQRGFCAKVLELGAGEAVREMNSRDQRYVLYRLSEAHLDLPSQR
jgi:4-amino-4-deoxy-L-arabinose transferase-like glycosyltransferase